eukprot:11699179-Prorocentrum_lima.AAC.1
MGLAPLRDEVWRSLLPEQQRWRLCNAAVARAQESGGPAGHKELAPCLALEEALAAVGAALGLKPKPGLKRTKEILREYGEQGRVLASRLGRLSKGRN